MGPVPMRISQKPPFLAEESPGGTQGCPGVKEEEIDPFQQAETISWLLRTLPRSPKGWIRLALACACVRVAQALTHA